MRNKKNAILLPVLLFTLVLALSIGGLIFSDNLRKARVENPGEYDNQDQIPRVTAKEAYQAVLNGEAILLDTRSITQFQTQHATGAISFPVSEAELRLGELDPEQWYITYCT
jgi:hypothetical protein